MLFAAGLPQVPSLPVKPPDPLGLVDPQGALLEPEEEEEPDESNFWVVSGVTAAVTGGILLWGSRAWWERGFEPFSWRETGFFERDTYAGGGDKIGHLYACYMLTHAWRPVYSALGVPRNRAAWLSAGVTLTVANGVEVIDGFTDFGFEYGDVIMNTIGVAIGLLTALYPAFDETFGIRIGYVPSRDFLANDKTVLKWINDYTGMLFFADLKVKGAFELFDLDPGWGRYLVTGVLFGTSQYSPVRRHELRRRSFGVHFGLSLSQILRDFGDGDEGVEAYASFFDYYAVPFLMVSIQRDLNTDQWHLNFGVANRVEVGL